MPHSPFYRERLNLWLRTFRNLHPVTFASMSSYLSLFQANRSRDLGATVYCVGVKDFNETQVKETLVVFTGVLGTGACWTQAHAPESLSQDFSSGLALLLLTVWQSKVTAWSVLVWVLGLSPFLSKSPYVENCPSVCTPQWLLLMVEKSRWKDTWRTANQSGLSCRQKGVVGTFVFPIKLRYCHITLQFQSSFSFMGKLYCRKQTPSLVTLIFYSVLPFDSLISKFIIWMLVCLWITFCTNRNSWHYIFLTWVKHLYSP